MATKTVPVTKHIAKERHFRHLKVNMPELASSSEGEGKSKGDMDHVDDGSKQSDTLKQDRDNEKDTKAIPLPQQPISTSSPSQNVCSNPQSSICSQPIGQLRSQRRMLANSADKSSILDAREPESASAVLQSPVATCKSLMDIPTIETEKNTLKKKPLAKSSNNMDVYPQKPKNYRHINKKDHLWIPYRRGYEAFEGRIISIHNHLHVEKNCKRELEGLAERMPKILKKDFMNKYVISALRTVIRVAAAKGIYEVTTVPYQQKSLIQRLNDQYQDILARIRSQLLSNQSIEMVHLPQESLPQPVPGDVNAIKRRVYEVLKARASSSALTLPELRQRADKICSALEQGYYSQQRVIQLIRSAPQLPC